MAVVGAVVDKFVAAAAAAAVSLSHTPSTIASNGTQNTVSSNHSHLSPDHKDNKKLLINVTHAGSTPGTPIGTHNAVTLITSHHLGATDRNTPFDPNDGYVYKMIILETLINFSFYFPFIQILWYSYQ